MLPSSRRVRIRWIVAKHEIASSQDCAECVLAGFADFRLCVIAEGEEGVEDDQQGSILPRRVGL